LASSNDLLIRSIPKTLAEKDLKQAMTIKLWLDACVLCETQKPSVVAKALGLRFDELTKRVEALSGEACVKKKRTSRRAGGFIELGRIT
jgi:hypothetical protein